jgi:hypothetical protein
MCRRRESMSVHTSELYQGDGSMEGGGNERKPHAEAWGEVSVRHASDDEGSEASVEGR